MQPSDRKSILRRIAKVEQQIARLKEQHEEAETTLRSLRKQLERDDAETTSEEKHSDEVHAATTAEKLTPAEKVALFLRLFQGREDVYPKLWQNHKTGKQGYSPACANE